MDWLPFLWSTLRLIFKVLYRFISIPLVATIIILSYYFWPWPIVYLISSSSIIISFFLLFKTIRGKINPWSLILLFLLIWGFVITYLSKQLLLLAIITLIISLALVIFNTLLRIDPMLYIYYLQQDKFDHYYWMKYRKTDWKKIFIRLKEKEFQNALTQFPKLIFYRIPTKKKTTTAFLHCTLDYWVEESIPLEEGVEYPVKNKVVFLKKLKLEHYIHLFLDPETLVSWLDYAHQNPIQYPLLAFVFKTFNDKLSAYILSPYELDTTYMNNFNPGRIEAQTTLLLSKILNTEAPLNEAIGLSQGLLLLSFAMHKELKGIQNEMVEE